MVRYTFVIKDETFASSPYLIPPNSKAFNMYSYFYGNIVICTDSMSHHYL